MMPQPLVEGDERMVMVPAIFTCKQTLAELQHTPIPSSSALIITYLKSGKCLSRGIKPSPHPTLPCDT